jgi:diguanylate cyclase (GGDEF)-like protein
VKFFDYKFTFVGIFFFIATILLLMFHTYKQKELHSFLDLQTKEAKHRYDGITLFPKDTSTFMFNYLINKPEVIDIFKYAYEANDDDKAIVRDKLYKYLEPIYIEFKKYNIQQLHFHLPNNDSFLRFHKPSKFGDNLSNVRATVAYTNKHKVYVEGFEEGRIFNGYRFVFPLFDEKKKHIGSVEISHSMKSFKNTYQRAFKNIGLDILIDKEVVKNKVFETEPTHYEPSIINNNFMHQKTMIMSEKVEHASESIKNLEEIKLKMKMYEDFSIAIDHKKHKGVVSFIAIHNPITHKYIAYAVSFERSDYLGYFYDEKSREIKYILFVVLLLTLVLYFAIKFNKELGKKVYMDSMMEIYNRRFFEAYLSESCKKQKRNDTYLSLIMFDVDHFKNINDTYGHDVGDTALQLLSKVVKEHTRQTDVFARWGGEEFMLLLDVSLVDTQRVAENLRLSIEECTRDYDGVPEFTCSFGVISLEGIMSLDEAFKEVDSKLYEAKETGRNKVVV